jgi:hypothetical protein
MAEKGKEIIITTNCRRIEKEDRRGKKQCTLKIQKDSLLKLKC